MPLEDKKLKKAIRSIANKQKKEDDPELTDNLAWLSGISLQFNDCTLKVSFIHKYFGQWFLQNYKEIFTKIINEYFADKHVTTIYEQPFSPPLAEQAQLDHPAKINSSVQNRYRYCGHDDDYDEFASYILNDKNSFSLEAAKTAACLETDCNLLIICGNSGTGKSHLLNAIYKTINRRYGPETALYRKAAIFCADNCKKNYLARPEIFWKKRHALILDDLQELAGEVAWQDLLSCCIDYALSSSTGAEVKENGNYYKKTVLAFSGTASKLSCLRPRLLNRLENGLVMELREPDLDVRLKFLECAAKELKISLNREQLLYLARNILQIPALAGFLRKIKFYAAFRKRQPSIQELETLMRANSNIKSVNWKDITEQVAEKLGLKQEEIMSKSRKPDFVLARQIIMYLCRRILGLSYPELGRIFGGKDHSTVIHGIKKIEELSATDKDMHNLLTELENQNT